MCVGGAVAMPVVGLFMPAKGGRMPVGRGQWGPYSMIKGVARF